MTGQTYAPGTEYWTLQEFISEATCRPRLYWYKFRVRNTVLSPLGNLPEVELVDSRECSLSLRQHMALWRGRDVIKSVDGPMPPGWRKAYWEMMR